MEGSLSERSLSSSSTVKRSRPPPLRRRSAAYSDDDDDDRPSHPSSPSQHQSYADRLNSLLGRTTAPLDEGDDDDGEEEEADEDEAEFRYDGNDGTDFELAHQSRQAWLDEHDDEDEKTPVRAYDDALRDMLGEDGDEGEYAPDRGDDELDTFQTDPHSAHTDDDRSERTVSTSSRTPVGFSASFSPTSQGAASPSGSQTSSTHRATPSRRPPFLHPTVSRLRSHMRNPSSSSSVQTTASFTNGLNGDRVGLIRSTSTSSHFSQLSRTTSSSTLHSLLQPIDNQPSSSSNGSSHPQPRPTSSRAPFPPPQPKPRAEDAFHYTSLRRISAAIYPPPATTNKASATKLAALGLAVQDRDRYGKPVLLAVGGLVCVGTDQGWVGTWTFGGDSRGWYGNDTIAKEAGAVTALALSPDHTYLAVGHAHGHIYLYQLDTAPPPPPPAKSSRSSSSTTPVGGLSVPTRTALPVQLSAALAGKREGHLVGTRIVHLGFVGKRHTAIVSGDEQGMAFYHSLGRVLGVDSTDILRVLGSYPVHPQPRSLDPAAPRTKTPAPTTLYATSPLPLGSHPSDAYQLCALVTPTKLVIVGLKPSPRTWFRKLRERPTSASASSESLEGTGGGVWRTARAGVDPLLAYWWAGVVRFVSVRVVEVDDDGAATTRAVGKGGAGSADAVRRVEFPDAGRWEAEGLIHGVEWLNDNHLLVLTASALSVVDTRTMERVERSDIDCRILVHNDFYKHLHRPRVTKVSHNTVANEESVVGRSSEDGPHEPATRLSASGSVAGSFSSYKGKVFFLTKADVRAGSVVTWSDRLLALIGRGDMLGAIRLARTFYVGLDKSTVIGLPESPTERQRVVGLKLDELMRSSLAYTFSDERMTDSTHDSRDGRGVDRTALFEGLVTETAEACLALGELDFLVEDVFDRYEQAGIEAIFLSRLEPFILDGRIRTLPTNVVQRLFRLRDSRDSLDALETLIWHVDPHCVDIHQAVTLCKKHALWDALVHVYNRSLADYVSPVVDLLAIVRTVHHHRTGRPQRIGGEFDPSTAGGDGLTDDEVEALVPDAYRLYSYLSEVLSGLAYPSREPLPEQEAISARTSVYAFLFSGRTTSAVPGGPLVSTVAQGGSEPTYPYLRLLLQFDAEAFLHAIDIAFEDPYLNDDVTDRVISRQLIVTLLLDCMDLNEFSPSDVTLLHIFVARNLPKYPQFVILPPSTLHRLLDALALDPDQSTREDRQLAAEYLLSAYTPHDPDRMLALFESAGFFRILRSTYRAERRWAPLVATFLQDPDGGLDVFAAVDEVLSIAVSPSSSSSRTKASELPSELRETVLDAIGHLSELGVRQTALLVDRHLPASHAAAIQSLASSPHKQFGYLRCLLEPARTDAEEESGPLAPRQSPSTQLDARSRHLYVALLARFDPASVVRLLEASEATLKELGAVEGGFDLSEVVSICEDVGPPEAVVWALDRQGHTRSAFAKVGDVIRIRGADLAAGFAALRDGDVGSSHQDLHDLRSVTRMGVQLCLAHSTASPSSAASRAKTKDRLPVEDMWFGLLHELIELVHAVSGLVPASDSASQRPPHSPLRTSSSSFSPFPNDSPPPPLQSADSLVLDALRALVQETLAALVASNATSSLSFPTLFKQLVDASSTSSSTSSSSVPGEGRKRAYSEFRAILTGMLDTSKADAEVLQVTIRLVERDLFESVRELSVQRARGWRPKAEDWQEIGEVRRGKESGEERGGRGGLVVFRSGKVERAELGTPSSVGSVA